MESSGSLAIRLDGEFDQYLVDMKPYVLRLTHKSERQRCALWIKKLCEPQGAGLTGRKNRNLYAQLMVQMLKKNNLEGPFTHRPEEGPLPTMPAYMSVYFEDHDSPRNGDNLKSIPAWVNALGDSHSTLHSSVGTPGATSTLRSARERFAEVVSNSPRSRRRTETTSGRSRDRSHSPRRSPPRTRTFTGSRQEGRIQFEDDIPQRKPFRTQQSSDDDDIRTVYRRRSGSPVRVPSPTRSPTFNEGDGDWSKGADKTLGAQQLRGSSLYRDEASLIRQHERELEMKTKMMEAKFHEEKLRLQQKHDAAVQKILDRKNAEIEDVKGHYRLKAKEQEDINVKLEKKVNALVKEASVVRENKDKQISELKKLVEDSSQSKQNEYEKRIHDMVANFEQEKFEMQKSHTKNIQELLDDTNARLQKMEQEYSQQTASTTLVIRDLEARVQQVTSEAETTTTTKNSLERYKIELEGRIERLQSELQDYQSKYTVLDKEHQKALENHEQEIKATRTKHEATLEYLNQEHSLAVSKASDAIDDLEQQVSQLKQALYESDNQRQRQLREMEQIQHQDKQHKETLHDQKVSGLKKELDQLEQTSQNKIRKLEQVLRDKDTEIRGLVEQSKQQARDAEQSLEEFKTQMDRNSNRVYSDMKQQMDKVEADLDKSKQMREKQSRELTKQLDDERRRHEQEVADLKMQFEQEKSGLLRDFHNQKEALHLEKEQELDNVRENQVSQAKEADSRASERQERDAKTITELEQQVRDVREEISESNQLRKQQLVELGLLREEEKQKMLRDHEGQVAKLKSQMEQQKLEIQKNHTIETEKILEKTNSRLKEIEKEYTLRLNKTSETITELQKTQERLRQERDALRVEKDKALSDTASRHDDEKKNLRRQHSGQLLNSQQEVETMKTKIRQYEKRLQNQEADYEDKLTELRLEYQDKMKGLMPTSMRQELEDTISSLKAQIKSLQKRALVLQEEVEAQSRFASSPFGVMSTPIKSP